jgi:hypothetical protein
VGVAVGMVMCVVVCCDMMVSALATASPALTRISYGTLSPLTGTMDPDSTALL